MPNVKAIGTPMPTHAATSTTKNNSRLPKPIATSAGCRSHRTPATPPTSARPNANDLGVVVSNKRSSAITAARLMPTRMASTRYPSEICSEISVT